MSKRGANGSPSKRPAKRARGGGIGATTQADDTARLIAAHHAAEHVQGSSYLSKRSLHGGVRSLLDISLRASAEALLEVVQVGHDAPDAGELAALRDFVEHLPPATANLLFALVLGLSTQADRKQTGELDNARLAKLFLHPNTTVLSLAGLGPTAHLLSRVPDCSALADLDLASNTMISDNMLKTVLPKLGGLRRIVLRGCTKVGDASIIALSVATGPRLKDVNLSMTAVTIKGLTSLLARCSALEVLKLANVQGLNEKAITKLVDDATSGAMSFRHLPLSNLRTLKLRSTELSDSSLGRLLALCALSLTSLDVSYSHVKSLDILSRALHSAPTWRLAKLVASGLPLTPASLVGFFQPLSERPEVERNTLRTLKLGSLPDTGTKQPGLTDAVLGLVLPFLEKLEGLEVVSLFQNWGLGKNREPMTRFMEVVGRRCTFLDLTLNQLQTHHLDGLFPPEDGTFLPPPRLLTLVLDSSKITDEAAPALSTCKDLQALHVAETRISTTFLKELMMGCRELRTLNLTSCRGVPVVQRRTFFEAFKRGEVD